jgi:tetratricopeptide (TPR) repeat protein
MKRWRSMSVSVLAASGLFLYAFPSATLTYGAVILLHLAAGIALTVLLLPFLARLARSETFLPRLAWILLALGAILGIVLTFLGTPARLRGLLYFHIFASLAGSVLLAASWLASRGWLGANRGARALRFSGLLLITAVIAAGAWWTRVGLWSSAYRISNPLMPPAAMEGEGDGPKGPYFPSSAQTKHGGYIPAKYFMQSEACQRCHADIYDQWNSSAHHFSSFNNQWYRKSVEYMQDAVGVRPSKWCAGCHDPALLFSGLFDMPIKQIVERPESHAGLSCMMCHSIVQVKSSMGQGDYVLEYPKLHELAASENPLTRRLHDFMVRLNPEPHRRTFLKPFMRNQTAEFCSTCHKVHLDVPVNHYRWVRGFNEYDNWQASGVSGQGARSFYYPAKPQKCVDCHMPLVPSKDDGNVNGLVHSHRFPGANTAVPYANEDKTQLELSQRFLKDGNLSVDIFAMSPAGPEAAGGEAPRAEFATAFAVGEEAELARPGGAVVPARAVTAPLGRVDAAVRRRDEVLVDVVVRTKKVGHFFPGGTVDAFDVWLELKATDEKGQTLFWSGMVEDGGKGPVEKGAHFYRSLQLDAHGNRINKRNAWATRAVMYVRLIPPGAADTAHFRLRVPDNAGEHITLDAKLNYRKFAWWNTQFSFAGMRDPKNPGPVVTPDYDDNVYVFTGDTSNVSGKRKEIPDLPILTLAEDTKTLRVLPRSAQAPEPQVVLAKEDWQRWNDYGIGLFLQGDLKGAEAAFEKVAQVDSRNPDGWVNIGRARVQEGDIEGARKALEKALALQPDLARANYFYARVLKAEGNYDDAIGRLRLVLGQYPRDRVVRNELGRILFLEKKYADAVKEFEAVLSVDPEDLQAHYNLMLCYNGLGDERRANEHKLRYLRFKADESSQTITGAYRRANPEDNNERQAIHEHVSVRLDGGAGEAAHARAARKPMGRPGGSS